MQPSFAKHLLFGACASVMVLGACGHKKGSGSAPPADENTEIIGGLDPANNPSSGSAPINTQPGSNPDGIAVDGNVGSTDPHPASCTTCDTAEVTAVASCPNTIGTPVPCEGFCFVVPEVTPQWFHEPPASGPAYPSYEYIDYTKNFHEVDAPLARGYWVHNLAHGFVVIAYNCPGGCDAELAVLRTTIFPKYRGQGLIVTPDPELVVSRFSAQAWTWQYTFDALDEAALSCFIAQHQQHPYRCHTAPRTATCP